MKQILQQLQQVWIESLQALQPCHWTEISFGFWKCWTLSLIPGLSELSLDCSLRWAHQYYQSSLQWLLFSRSLELFRLTNFLVCIQSSLSSFLRLLSPMRMLSIFATIRKHKHWQTRKLLPLVWLASEILLFHLHWNLQPSLIYFPLISLYLLWTSMQQLFEVCLQQHKHLIIPFNSTRLLFDSILVLLEFLSIVFFVVGRRLLSNDLQFLSMSTIWLVYQLRAVVHCQYWTFYCHSWYDIIPGAIKINQWPTNNKVMSTFHLSQISFVLYDLKWMCKHIISQIMRPRNRYN